MLMLLPPSEGKRAPGGRGRPVDLAELSFGELTGVRQRLLGGLVEASSRPDAAALLGVPPGAAAEVAANVHLLTAPARLVSDIYTGVLFQALDAGSLAPAAKRRAARRLVVTSALWGAVRWTDRIPTYRMPVCSRIPGTDERLEPLWRAALDPVLAAAAGNAPVIDFRSSSYLALWRPHGLAAERWVRVGARTRAGVAISHNSKHTRGLIARALLESSATVRRVEDLPTVLSDYEIRLTQPPRPGAGWTLDVIQD